MMISTIQISSRCYLMVVGFAVLSFATLTTAASDPPRDTLASRTLTQGVCFLANHGRVDPLVAYYVKGGDKTLFFTKRGLIFDLPGKGVRSVVRMEFVDANDEISITAHDPKPTRYHFFRGSPDSWHTDVQGYERIVYESVWPGIDLQCRLVGGSLKCDFIVSPGADHENVRLQYLGADDCVISACGDLVLTTSTGRVVDGRPYAFQEIDGTSVDVAVSHSIERLPSGAFEARFAIGSYDRDHPLVIDPEMTLYCGYVGGLDADYSFGIAVDDVGATYITGHTQSDEATFPVIAGPDLTYNGGDLDAFVAKIDPTGSALLYCGYIGGVALDKSGVSIAVDPAGSAYVVGETASDETSFPVFVGPDLIYNGANDAYIAKLSPDGKTLEYCGYVGGDGWDSGWGVAVDSEGSAYLTGFTGSTEATFPVAVGPSLTNSGQGDAFVAKVQPDGKGLIYCGFIGGDVSDNGRAITVADDGGAYVVGSAQSDETTFPVHIGPDLTFNGGARFEGDAFIARVNPNGERLDYCGYIGGDADDRAWDVAVDARGRAYVIGITESNESTFPVRRGPDLTYGGGFTDGFIARVTARGVALDYCGYLGGDDTDEGWSVAVDDLGRAFVTGFTASTESSFPVSTGPDLTHNGGTDGFVARIDASGTRFDFSGFFGGTEGDFCRSLDLDSRGNVYVAGYTFSPESTFPVNEGPSLSIGGALDAFVAKFPAYYDCQSGATHRAVEETPANVLLVNGSAGTSWRTVAVGIGYPIEIAMLAPPAAHGPSAFALYAWLDAPDSATLAPQPFGAGTACFPTPLSTGKPAPIHVWNNIGKERWLGEAHAPSSPAPSVVVSSPDGWSRPITITCQGFIADPASIANFPVSLTNAVILEVRE